MSADSKILQTIAEGHYAGAVLEVYGALMDELVEETLKSSDRMILDHELTPELAFALLHEIYAYRRPKMRLKQRVTRGENSQRAAYTPNGDGVTDEAASKDD